METKEQIKILRAACEAVQLPLGQLADILAKLGRPVMAQHCQKYQQQCLEALELSGVEPQEPVAELVDQEPEPELEPQVIPEIKAEPAPPTPPRVNPGWNRGPKPRIRKEMPPAA